jgi:hypothetical protein
VLHVVGLADHSEVRALGLERRQQLVDVAADTPTVGGDGGRVDDDARCVRQEELRDGLGGGLVRDYENGSARGRR